MALPGKLFVSRAEPHNRARVSIAEAIRVHVANGDGTFMEWLLTTPHTQNGSSNPIHCYADEIYHVQGVQRGRLYRGAFYDWTQRQSAGGVHAPAAYDTYTATGSRTYGHTTPASKDWIRWAVPGGMTHFRIWATLYDTANPCDISMIQQNAGGATLATAAMAHNGAKVRYRPSAWVSIEEGAAFIKALNDVANVNADFILVGVQFIDLNTEVEPDAVGACMFDSDGGSGVDIVLAFPDQNAKAWSSTQLACYHQANGVAFPTTEPNGSASPQFGDCSHKGTYGGLATVEVDGVAWNSKTDAPIQGDNVVVAYQTNVSSDYIYAPGYTTIYKVAELDVAMTWNKWEVDIVRTLLNSEAAARDIIDLFSVLLSVPYSMTHVAFGGRAPQSLSGGSVFGQLGDRVMRITGGPLGVVIIGEHTVGRDVGTNGVAPRLLDNASFFRGYIQFASGSENGAPYVLASGERIDWSARCTIVNEADEGQLHAGVTITESGDSTDVAEDGPTNDSYTIVLNSAPTADVTITVQPDFQTDLGSGAGVAIILTFTNGDWNTPQTVSVTAVDDDIDEASPHTSTITHTAASVDGNYDGIAIGDVTINITDNDASGGAAIAANLYQKSISTGPGFVALAAGPLVMDVTIVVSGSNTDNVTVRSAGGGGVIEADWPPGAVMHLRNVDLSKISVAGPNGNLVLVVGQAP